MTVLGAIGSQPHAALFPRKCAALLLGLVGLACNEQTVIGEGQFSRPIELISDPAAPLPRMAWRPGQSCPGPAGGCTSYCEGPPESCAPDACMPLLVDSGTPLSLLPSTDGGLDYALECLELRAGSGLLEDPDNPEVLAQTTAAFRLRNSPILRAPGDQVAAWAWEAGDDRNPVGVGGVIGGNILRDFAIELRHLPGEAPEAAFFSQYPGSESVLADQGRAYIRLQHPGRLLGRLLNDACELGEELNCRIGGLNIDRPNLLFESTRALVDACVAPPPCAVAWDPELNTCGLNSGGLEPKPCPHFKGGSATLLVATGVPGLVLFDDSAAMLFGPLEELPSCASVDPESDAPACLEDEVGRLVLPGWAPLEQLRRLRVRALALVEGLEQPQGSAPCERLRTRMRGLVNQCGGFAAEGRPVRPTSQANDSVSDSALILGEAAWGPEQISPDTDAWLETLVVPASAAPVIALRREVVPEGAQPDGMIGGAMLEGTETVLDFTEAEEAPGVRVRCLDPGQGCTAIPRCEVDGGELDDFDGAGGRTGCCYGLPADLVIEVVASGVNEAAPRLEDVCCPALPRAAIDDLQSLGLCSQLSANF